ncbi:hypothetical protein BOX15_Mlig024026g2 [Macrostomum lignano]|uniref:RRM domain-containing protein n=2 Tax=Macrostomum lignano TaxID=282301 RepID=A0A267ERC7_9PLAT|nr:hypothetical protein BOX15_Mlig024026g2 [Macrostomum lignano]
MEVVQNFNKEMKSLLDHRPPVSRQKMSMITKSAIRGIKFYKHIVQSVEKFIQKCSPDYKVPGLYVMDAIIRQSRHQYGAERDVFAPRFLKNLLPTFQQLFRCDEKDRPLVVRVLNLWLKNETFPPEVIQSLLSLADNPEDANLLALAQAQVSVAINNQATASSSGGNSARRLKRPHHHHGHHHGHRQRQHSSQDFVDNNDNPIGAGVAMETMPVGDGEFDYVGDNSNEPSAAEQASIAMPQGGIISSVAELLQKFQDSDDVRDQINQLQSLQEKILQQSSMLSQQQMIDPEILAQLQVLLKELTKTARAAFERDQEAQRAKDVVAYDYGDESDSDDNAGSNGLQRQQRSKLNAAYPATSGGVDQNFLDQLQQMTDMLEQTRVLQEQLQSAMMQQQLEEAEQQQQQQHEEQFYQQQQTARQRLSYEEGEIDEEALAKAAVPAASSINKLSNYNDYGIDNSAPEGSAAVEETGADRSRHGHSHGHSHHSTRHPARSPATATTSSRRRRRSHSGGGRGESSERRRKERKRKSLPRLRNGRLSIVSATIFIGKLQKSTTEARLRSLLEEYGQVQALVLISSRGCGFVVYSKRKHAAKAIDKLRSTRLDGASLRVAWAPNKGIKDSELKEYWDEEEGCTYIPYEKFPRDQSWRELLQGGAFIDQDSVPIELIDLLRDPDPPDAADQPLAPPPPPPPAANRERHCSASFEPAATAATSTAAAATSAASNDAAEFSCVHPPPPMPPTVSSTLTSSTSAAADPAPPPAIVSPTAAVAASKQPPQRTTLLPMPPPPPSTQPPQQPPQQPHQHVRTPIPPPRPRPPQGFFRGGIGGGGGGIGSGILRPPLMPPQALFPPRGGGIGAWRGGIRRGGL